MRPLRASILFLPFYLAKKTCPIIEGIQYLYILLFLVGYHMENANKLFPRLDINIPFSFSFLGNVFSREYVLLEIPLTASGVHNGS